MKYSRIILILLLLLFLFFLIYSSQCKCIKGFSIGGVTGSPVKPSPTPIPPSSHKFKLLIGQSKMNDVNIFIKWLKEAHGDNYGNRISGFSIYSDIWGGEGYNKNINGNIIKNPNYENEQNSLARFQHDDGCLRCGYDYNRFVDIKDPQNIECNVDDLFSLQVSSGAGIKTCSSGVSQDVQIAYNKGILKPINMSWSSTGNFPISDNYNFDGENTMKQNKDRGGFGNINSSNTLQFGMLNIMNCNPNCYGNICLLAIGIFHQYPGSELSKNETKYDSSGCPFGKNTRNIGSIQQMLIDITSGHYDNNIHQFCQVIQRFENIEFYIRLTYESQFVYVCGSNWSTEFKKKTEIKSCCPPDTIKEKQANWINAFNYITKKLKLAGGKNKNGVDRVKVGLHIGGDMYYNGFVDSNYIIDSLGLKYGKQGPLGEYNIGPHEIVYSGAEALFGDVDGLHLDIDFFGYSLFNSHIFNGNGQPDQEAGQLMKCIPNTPDNASACHKHYPECKHIHESSDGKLNINNLLDPGVWYNVECCQLIIKAMKSKGKDIEQVICESSCGLPDDLTYGCMQSTENRCLSYFYAVHQFINKYKVDIWTYINHQWSNWNDIQKIKNGDNINAWGFISLVQCGNSILKSWWTDILKNNIIENTHNIQIIGYNNNNCSSNDNSDSNCPFLDKERLINYCKNKDKLYGNYISDLDGQKPQPGHKKKKFL